MKIFLYGVSGVGKTYISKIIGKKNRFTIINADDIRRKVQKGKSRKEYPFLYLSTGFGYSQFGELDKANIVKGLLAVRRALAEAVELERDGNDNLIMEGAFLDPNLLKKFGKVILITTTEEKRHKKQFLGHVEKWLDFKGNEFKSARILQRYLVEEANDLGIEIVDNGTDNLKDYFEARQFCS